MDSLNLINIYSIETLFIPLVFGVFLLLLIIRLRADKEFVLSITDKKNKRNSLISFISDELNGLENQLEKLKRDIEVVNHYNVMHLGHIDAYLSRYMHLYKYLELLDDNVLCARIKEFGIETKKLAEDINFLEQTIYDARLGFQKYIDNATAKHANNSISSEEYVQELNFQRDKILKFIEQNNTQRYIQLDRISALIKECLNIEKDLMSYKKDKVETKHFYVKHMVYA